MYNTFDLSFYTVLAKKYNDNDGDASIMELAGGLGMGFSVKNTCCFLLKDWTLHTHVLEVRTPVRKGSRTRQRTRRKTDNHGLREEVVHVFDCCPGML